MGEPEHHAVGPPPRPGLGPYARELLRHPTPWIIGAWFAGALAVRISRGAWTWRDPVILAVVVVLQPFSEWLIHVTVLHFRPRTVAGRVVDLHLAREHRRHHRDPGDVRLTLIPLPELVAAVVGVSVVSWFVAIDHGDAATVMISVASMLGVYEWTHFLIHSTYRPRGRHLRAVRRSHRLHHYRNEHHWMGITTNVADRVLGTFPDRGEVEPSDTARTLTPG